jgi:hypothetical protein
VSLPTDIAEQPLSAVVVEAVEAVADTLYLN